MKNNKVFFVVVVLALILAACAGNAGQGNGGSGNGLPVELAKVRYISYPIPDTVYVANAKGFCEPYGVEIEIVSGLSISGPNVVQAVSAGVADAGLVAIAPIINAAYAGLPVQMVADVQSGFEEVIIEKWYVRSDSDLYSLADVAGKKYAVNNFKASFHYTTLMALPQAGVDENDVEFIMMPFAQQIESLINGEVDVIGLPPPWQQYLELEYGDQVRELWNDYEFYGPRQVSATFVNRTWAAENPEVVSKFVTCLAETANWIQDNQRESLEIFEAVNGVSADISPPYLLHQNAEVAMEDVQFWFDYLVSRGDVANPEWLTIEDLATNRYNGLANPE